MPVHQFAAEAATFIGSKITPLHFGANVIMTKDFLDDGGMFDRFVNQMNLGLLRFPGGTVTEINGFAIHDRQYDVTNPLGFDDDGSRIVTYPAFYDYADQQNLQAMVVLPTEKALTGGTFGERHVDPSALYRTLSQFELTLDGAYGPADIHTVAIGNEFWYMGDRMTAEEYGDVANQFATGLQWVIDNHWDDLPNGDLIDQPRIAVQAALGSDAEGNQAIIDALDMDARAAIDTVIQHYYPGHYHVADDMDRAFDRMGDFERADGFGDLDRYISEWNIKSDDGNDTGMEQASSMIELMQSMLEEGVDQATVWGTQYLSLRSRLAEVTKDSSSPTGYSYHLTAAGEAFRMMSTSLQGLRVIDAEAPGGMDDFIHLAPEDRPDGQEDQLAFHAFGDGHKTVVFLASHALEDMDLSLDLSEITGDFGHVWAQKLTVVDDPSTPTIDEGDPTGIKSSPHVTTMMGDSFMQDGKVEMTLKPWEIVKLEFTTGRQNLQMDGHDWQANPRVDMDDSLVGANGHDQIRGQLGDDTLCGMAGRDTLEGGKGNDLMYGGYGDDRMIGGEGNDTLHGGTGSDTLVANGGNDKIWDASGTNHFVVSAEGNATISGMTAADGQTLSFMDAYDKVSDVMQRVTVEGEGLRITHDDGFSTLLDGYGTDTDALSAQLSDFMRDSPVADLVDELTAPVPDGRPQLPTDTGAGAGAGNGAAADPVTDDRPDYTLSDFLLTRQPDELADYIGSLDTDEFADLLDKVNADILFYTMRPEALTAFMNALDPAQLDLLMDDLDPGTVGFRMLRLGPKADDFLQDLGTDSLVAVFREIDATDRGALRPHLSGETIRDLHEAMPDERLFPATGGNDGTGPDPVDDPDDDNDDDYTEEEEEAALASSGGGCFVATAAYGDVTHPDVEYLRLLRDMVLVRSRWGRAFVNTYWVVGPWLARAVRPYPRAQAVARGALGLLVAHLRQRQVIVTKGRRPRHWRDHRV